MLLTDFPYFKCLRGRISNLIIKTKKRQIALTRGSSLKILCEILKSVLSQELRDKVSSIDGSLHLHFSSSVASAQNEKL